MTLAKGFSAKVFALFAAAAMVFTLAAPAAQAQSADELQQMINDLLAQVSSLQGQLGGGTSGGSMAAGVCPYSWTRDLSAGSTGMDVMKLQQFLNADPDTRVAASGVGSAGMETEYFGALTGAAVSKFQVKYRAEILSPLGLVNPTQYFGAGSRAQANAMCTATIPTDDMDDDDDDMMDDDDDDMTDDDDDDDTLRGGEADVDDYDFSDEEDEVAEGEEDVPVLSAEFDVEDGDVRLERLDIRFENTVDGDDDEDDPWEAFDEISIWVDGEKVASEDVTDEDDWDDLGSDIFEFRISSIDAIFREDETGEVVIAVSAQNGVDIDGATNEDDWDIFIPEDGFRFMDSEGLDIEGPSSNGDASTFEITEEGEDEEFDISISSDSPDSTDIIVDTDTDTDDVTIMIADLEAEDGDLDLETVVVRVDTSGASTTDVIDDIRIVIDGEEFDAEALGGTPGTPSTVNSVYTDNDGSDDAIWYVFDVDGDITIEDGEEVEMEVVVDFNDTNDGARYANGTQIQAQVSSTERDEWVVDGADELEDGDKSGSAVGDEHTLVADGIVVPADGVTVDESTSGDNDTTGTFEIEFEVTAVEDDFYIYDRATVGAFDATSTGVTYQISNSGGVVSTTTSGVLSSTADEDNSVTDFFVVREGETETFTLTVTVNPDTGGQYRVSLTGVGYSDDNVADDADDDAYQPVPVQDFRTGYININAS